MTPLLRRIFREWRTIVVPLSVAAVLNVLAYVAIIYPLSLRASATAAAQGRGPSAACGCPPGVRGVSR